MDFKIMIAGEIASALDIAFGNAPLSADEIAGLLELPPDSAMGDYAFPCFKLARSLRKAPPMIAGELRRYLRDYSPIRVSRSLRDTAYRVLQCRQQLTDANGREPSIDEIAQALDLPPAQITAALDAITAPVSLYEPVYSEGGDALTVMDQVRDRKNTDEQWIESITLREAISHLSEREKRILALRFEAGRTQMEVAGQIGISQAQVSRLEKSAIRSIRKAILPS